MRRLRRAALAALGCLGLALPASGALAAPSTPLDHSGRWITDAAGRVVILHGVNMVYKQPPYLPSAAGFDDQDAAFLEQNGFNSVRLGVIYKGVEPSPGAYDDGYLDQIAATEATLARHGIFTQLDFHQDMYNERFQGEGLPDWAVQDDGLPNTPQFGFPTNYFAMPALIHAFDHFWANDPGPGGVGLEDRYAAAWAHVAQRFAYNGHTVGFDLMNEPWPGTPWTTCFVPTGCPLFDNSTMVPFYQRVIDQIRSVDRQKLLWYEPNVLFNFGADSSIPRLGDASTGFSFHVYCTPGSAGINELNRLGCNGLDERVFQNADKQATETGDALMMSEFGATDDLATIRLNVEQADRHMVSWQYWHYCECIDPTTSGTGTQAIVIDPNQPPTGSNVKQAKLDVLSRPYPQLVAGTPHDYGFDESTRQFHLTYSTTGPGGRHFDARRTKAKRKHKRRGRAARKRSRGRIVVRAKSPTTEIFLGRSRYPGGYRVALNGGGIASKPGASVLWIVACPGRQSVGVTVRPAGAGIKNKVDCVVSKRRKHHKPGHKGRRA